MKLILPFVGLCVLMLTAIVWQVLPDWSTAARSPASRSPVAPSKADAPPAPSEIPQHRANSPNQPAHRDQPATHQPPPVPSAPPADAARSSGAAADEPVRWAGDYSRAQQATRSARRAAELAGSAPHPRALRAAAETALQAGDFARAAKYFERYTAQAPEDEQAWAALAACAAALERWTAARDTLTHLRRLAPHNPSYAADQARVFSKLGQLHAADRAWSAAIAADPANVSYRTSRARTAFALGEAQAALDELRAARDLAPADLTVRLLLGEVLLSERRLEAAEAELRVILDQNPRHVPGLNLLAATHYQRALSTTPPDATLADAAIAVWRESLSINPTQPQIEQALALAQERLYPD
jgi:tetratricopeptide (TPR) repeat protein